MRKQREYIVNQSFTDSLAQVGYVSIRLWTTNRCNCFSTFENTAENVKKLLYTKDIVTLVVLQKCLS